MEILNVQQFRDRTRAYFRTMGCDLSSCASDEEKERFIPRVESAFNEALEIQCKRANERDRKRFDAILARMEHFLIEKIATFEPIGFAE